MEKKRGFFYRLLFSKALDGKTAAHRVAYIAVMAALASLSNLFEIKFLDTQFSFTIFISLFTGIIIGPTFGFLACMYGDAIGFLLNSSGMYMPWVGLSTGLFAVISGIAFNCVGGKGKAVLWIKLAIVCFATFLICTIAVNSMGFYLYNKKMGFSTALLEYADEKFGQGVSFWIYVLYRLFFKLQIFNSLFNYALFFIVVPTLNKIKPLKMQIS